ncbi:hypothetical protein CA267_016365 [Alteromonas pelagimontana]|uniref:Uncharacterized protein n=1 Tax=Alteromonas pelagimontana TaxID=1858656 RepID=A0A6M4MGM4_9ALTE|nr:hypothetical protein [Alteromonas pelagimontana]QJR82212.1 hypothetical protein CA267_016365 [Alteromonas pelagimontana]
MKRNHKPVPSLFEWIEAGAGLVGEQIFFLSKTVLERLEQTQETFDDLQHRGTPIDARLRERFSPEHVFSSVQTLVAANPLFSLMPKFRRPAPRREEQLALLSAKLDMLVEQVALLAAKQASEKQQANETSTASTSNEKSANVKKDGSADKEKPSAPTPSGKTVSPQTAVVKSRTNKAAPSPGPTTSPSANSERKTPKKES